MPITKPDTETGWSKEFPQVDGDYFYRWRGQRTIYSIVFGKVWGALSGTEQHPPLEGAEWLGPFTASDFEQLIRLRKLAADALKYIEADPVLDDDGIAIVATLRESLKESSREQRINYTDG